MTTKNYEVQLRRLLAAQREVTKDLAWLAKFGKEKLAAMTEPKRKEFVRQRDRLKAKYESGSRVDKR